MRNLVYRLWRNRSLSNALAYLGAIWEWLKCGGRFLDDDEALDRHFTCVGDPSTNRPPCEFVEHDEDGDPKCGVCGCYVAMQEGLDRVYSKVFFPSEKCPKGKWPE